MFGSASRRGVRMDFNPWHLMLVVIFALKKACGYRGKLFGVDDFARRV